MHFGRLDRRAFFWYFDVRRPKNSVDHSTPKVGDAEVFVKVAERGAKAASTVRVWPFQHPGHHLIFAIDFNFEHGLRSLVEFEIQIDFIPQRVRLPAATDWMAGVDLR
jgi:hypothetical protein